MEIYRGRPAEKRGAAEEAAYDLLDGLEIEYLRADHPATNTMEDCAEIEKLMDMRACKNLFLRNKQKTRYFLVVISGEKRFDAHELASQLGLPRLSFAHDDAMLEMLGVLPGSVSILCMGREQAKGVTLIVDRDILNGEYFGCHPCASTSSLKIKTADIFERLLPAIGCEPVFYTPCKG